MDERRRPVRARAQIRTRAKQLRREETTAETWLWNGLRGWDFAKFRRQHPVDRFILDFYCPAVKLAVEVDGSVHDDQKERDEARTAVLRARGIEVIRFTNDEVMADTRAVLHRIKLAVRARTRSDSPLPCSPMGEGGRRSRPGEGRPG
jgi:very-short-patch-repair endonuclease